MEKQNKKINFGIVLAVYLLGIFMGAIDTGIVTPARTVIQHQLMVDDKTGIWMITIYTLAYAASIPIMGKLADRFGRKYVYLTSIFLFGLGSLLCGLSQNTGSFAMLLAARVVQAIGGGGILPIATAEFGTTFPQEKRGLALGLVGGVYGIANIFGASAGSAILDLFGTSQWQFIFYVNIPITIFILIAGFLALPNTKSTKVAPIDGIGIGILTMMVLSLLYGLKNIDFFAFKDTITSREVYPFLLLFVLLLPVFIFAERKAKDPVINLSYFKERQIIITLILSFITGIAMMGMIFVPQFSENALKVASGSGGYFVIILGLFAGVGAPVSGKLIDKFGVKLVLGFGFFISIVGSLFLIFVASKVSNPTSVVFSLIFIGLGIGFTMGTPLNYMMLANTKNDEANSSLATLSLIRSIGTAIAPAIMIGFLSHAGSAVSGNVMALLPKEVEVPPLPYAKELNEQFAKLKTEDATKEQFKNLTIPDLTTFQTIKISMGESSQGQMPEELLTLMKASDVTTITENLKILSATMFDQMTPQISTNIISGVEQGISGMTQAIASMDEKLKEMSDAKEAMSNQAQNSDAITKMTAGMQGMKQAKVSLEDTISKMETLKAAIPGTFESAKTTYLTSIEEEHGQIEKEFQDTLNHGFSQIYATVAIASGVGLVLLFFYRRKKEKVA